MHEVHNTSTQYSLKLLNIMFLSSLFVIYLQVGMQNSSLGVVLATAHFSSSPMVALPSAISAVIMNIMGSSLGFFWRYVDPSQEKDPLEVSQE